MADIARNGNLPSIKYLTRILDALSTHGELTVTNVAMLSRMNHNRCNAILKWLQITGLVNTRICNNKRYVALTQTGHDYARRLQEVNDVVHFSHRTTYNMYVQNVNELY